MRSALYIATAFALSSAGLFAGQAAAQEITVSGFVDFELYNSNDVDFGSDDDDYDMVVDARLDFDIATSSKAGLYYGAHIELDLDQSDAGDVLGTDAASFNDGYVYVDTIFGKLFLGDAGVAGKASSAVSTVMPVENSFYESSSASYSASELELIKYENSILGLNLNASVDDDTNWQVGAEYVSEAAGFPITIGATGSMEMFAASGKVVVGPFMGSASYFAEDSGDVDPFQATNGTQQGMSEILSFGLGYELDGLSVGAGYELVNYEVGTSDNHDYNSKLGFGIDYEFANGLFAGASFVSDDSTSDWTTVGRVKIKF